MSGRYTAAITSRAVSAATAARSVESAEGRLANRVLRTLLVLTLRVLRGLAFGNRQRFPGGAGEVAGEVHDLSDVIGGVRHRSIESLGHQKRLAANRDGASEIVRRQRPHGAKRRRPAVFPPAEQLFARRALRHFELAVAVAVGFFTVGRQEIAK